MWVVKTADERILAQCVLCRNEDASDAGHFETDVVRGRGELHGEGAGPSDPSKDIGDRVHDRRRRRLGRSRFVETAARIFRCGVAFSGGASWA